MYRQYDGYPSGHGLELAKFLAPKEMVNGIPVGGDTSNLANGIHCLAAQIVAHFKEGAGNIYLHQPNSRNIGEEYVYYIKILNGVLSISVIETGWSDKKDVEIFKGDVKDFLKFCKDSE